MALKDNYFTISEAAKQLKVTRQTISRWVAKGNVPAEKIGRETLIKKKDLHKYHRMKLSEAAADTIIALYLATAEDYCREKGYINANTPTAHAEFFDENDKAGIIYKLSDEDLAEVSNRVRPIVERIIKDIAKETGMKKKSPPKNKRGGKTSNK